MYFNEEDIVVTLKELTYNNNTSIPVGTQGIIVQKFPSGSVVIRFGTENRYIEKSAVQASIQVVKKARRKTYAAQTW